MFLNEVTITYPKALQVLHDINKILLENVKVEIPIIKKEVDRYGIPMITKTSFINITIPKNEKTIHILKDWYDLNWNNETGRMIYKSNIIGDMTVDEFNKEGVFVKKTICQSIYPIDWEELNNDIKITFNVDCYLMV